MKTGKIPESVLKRSVLRQLHNRRDEVLLGAGVGEDCAALTLEADEVFVMSTDPITGTGKPYTPSIYETSPIYPVLPKDNNKSNICPLHRKCIPDPLGYNEYPEDNVPLP